jgi:hypothetical protein
LRQRILPPSFHSLTNYRYRQIPVLRHSLYGFGNASAAQLLTPNLENARG